MLDGLFSYDFMQNAFAASAAVALLSGAVGWFLVLRGQVFAGHALSHVGFAGATGAALLGVPPFWGLVGTTVAAGIGMGVGGERLGGRDVAIGMVLAFSLGCGLLFLHFFTAFATQVTALLFGNVLAVDAETAWALAALAAASLLLLAVIARPLLFASLQPELAEARGVPLRRYSVLFLALVGLATAGSAQIVGVLLVFTLTVGPAAAAHRLATRAMSGLAVSAGLALLQAWGGLVLAFYTDWPASFWITALGTLCFLLAAAAARRRGAPRPAGATIPA